MSPEPLVIATIVILAIHSQEEDAKSLPHHPEDTNVIATCLRSGVGHAMELHVGVNTTLTMDVMDAPVRIVVWETVMDTKIINLMNVVI